MPKSDIDRTGEFPLFDQLSTDVRVCLLSAARTRKYDRGATICLQGDPCRALKIVKSGWVKQYRLSPCGNEAILATLGRGQSFDEIAALQGRASPTSAQAVDDCEVILIDLSTICSCQNAHREITAAVLSAASGHIDTMMDHIEQLKIKSGAQRLSEYLIDLSGCEGGFSELVLPYEKVLLAGKLGMKPESLSRAFGRLKTFGVASSQRRVTISDVSKLRAFAAAQAA
ncbi:Crp/Fnr family transcriptional regulator [Seohaeicola saemankumensis]|nr:Crp/Fnr family transcriptional regulator [Seohaeicola saemankumensis]MCA0872327.1 Crp/Fnr family transcriptional regulator [Seohaeicola saemankumensis]